MNNKTKCPKCQNDKSTSAKRYPGKLFFTCYFIEDGCGYRWTVYTD